MGFAAGFSAGSSAVQKGVANAIAYKKVKADQEAEKEKKRLASNALADKQNKAAVDYATEVTDKQVKSLKVVSESDTNEKRNNAIELFNSSQAKYQKVHQTTRASTADAQQAMDAVSFEQMETSSYATVTNQEGKKPKQMLLNDSVVDSIAQGSGYYGDDNKLYADMYDEAGVKLDDKGTLIGEEIVLSKDAATAGKDSSFEKGFANFNQARVNDGKEPIQRGSYRQTEWLKQTDGASGSGTKISDMPDVEQKKFIDAGYKITDSVSKPTRESYTKKDSSGASGAMNSAWVAYKTRTGEDIPAEEFKTNHWNAKQMRPYESTKDKVTAKATLVSDIVKHSKTVVSGKKKYNYDEASQNQAILEEVGLTGAVKKVQEKFITSRDNLPSLDRLKKAIETDMDNGVYSDSQYTSAIKKFVTRYSPKEWGILSPADRLNSIDALENEGAIGVETAAYLKENSGTAASAQEALRTFKNMVGGNAIISIDVRKGNLDTYIKNKKKKTADYARSAYNMGMQRDAGEYLFGDKEVKKKEPEYLYKTIGGKKKRAKNPKYKG